MISRETPSKQESSSTSTDNINLKAAGSSTTSWSRLKDPRIVRVSRAFGGKDRHSKVCTVRGLRDRRVRLSVPTAIQLYDLQDRLGLNQPSKVVDWLLNAAKNEIDELPPLHFPQGSFSASLLPMLNHMNSDKQALIEKSKDHVSDETREREENNWTRSSEEQQGRHDFNLGINNQEDHSYENQNQNQNQNPSLQSLMNTSSSSIPFNSFVRWDPSNLSLSHHPPRSSPPHQGDQDWHNFSLSQHHHQVLVYQPAAAASMQPYFQSQISASNAGFDAKEINFQNSHLSTSSPRGESSTLPARPVHFNMTANLLPSQNNDGRS